MKFFHLILITLIVSACGGATPDSFNDNEKLGSLPKTIIDASDNPTTTEKITLGRLLFWDPILSGDQDIACASCHHPNNAYAENIDLSRGVGAVGLSENRHSGKTIKRNAPTIINTAYNGINESGVYKPLNTSMFWDNRASSLEAQALAVLLSDVEMRGENFTEDEIINEISNRLSLNSEYLMLFTAAFGDNTINADRIVKALAAFERSIISNNSRFDQYALGDDSALNQQEIRGLNAFTEAGCNRCHSGPMFTDFKLHQLPVEDNPSLAAENIEDTGVENKFRTPSLRNVALTAPYMHNGTVSSLREAIEFYEDIDNPGNNPQLNSLDFEDIDTDTVSAIEAFLNTLTDEDFDRTIPESVPSGLKPGGNI